MSDTETKIALPDDGKCPCGEEMLTVARDQTEYTNWTKQPDGTWEIQEGYTVEEFYDGDPRGNVRLFCPTCGQYFKFPKELE